jgi:hypothetical protein
MKSCRFSPTNSWKFPPIAQILAVYNVWISVWGHLEDLENFGQDNLLSLVLWHMLA